MNYLLNYLVEGIPYSLDIGIIVGMNVLMTHPLIPIIGLLGRAISLCSEAI